MPCSQSAGLAPRDVDGVVVHATTVVTNALIERKGLATALLVTEGFRDVLRIRNEHRYEMYDPQIEFPEPLVPAELTFGVVGAHPRRRHRAGRARHGSRSTRSPRSSRRATCARSPSAFSTASPIRRTSALVGQRIGELLPDVFVTLSSDVAPQIREYPRASTASVNAYTMPISQPYLRAPERAARARGLSQRAADHAELRRGGRRRDRRTQPGAHDRERPGGGRARRLPLCRGARHRPADVVRHGRHHRQGLPDRERRAADHRPVRGRPPLPLQGRQRAAGHHPVDRHDRDRRRRRQHRPCRRARPAQGRPAERRLRSRARPATAAAATSRRSPTPTSCSACSTPTISSAAT